MGMVNESGGHSLSNTRVELLILFTMRIRMHAPVALNKREMETQEPKGQRPKNPKGQRTQEPNKGQKPKNSKVQCTIRNTGGEC
jgi:hypothetical protein